MNRGVYSLVLTDEVVNEIDRLAYGLNTSRSNMVNQILAEYVSYTTPEKRMREVFGRVESSLLENEGFEVLLQPSETMFSIRTSLRYKYNPAVRYSVELYRDKSRGVGELRVSLRSTSSTLVLYMMQYYRLWMKLEQSYIGGAEAEAEDGRYRRKLTLRSEAAGNVDIGEAIAAYIRAFDTGLKAYFTWLSEPQRAVKQVERIYTDYLRQYEPLL